MTNPTKEYYAMPVEGEPVNGDPRGPGKWMELKWPGVSEGYQINDLGDVLSPQGNMITAALNGRYLYVTLRTPDSATSGKSLRVDKLMLHTFVGDPVGNEVPTYIDGDLKNCHLDNLRYGPPPKRKSPTKRKATAKAEPKPTVRGTRPKSKADYDTIEVSRLYRHRGTGLVVTVDENGKTKLPKVNLSAAEMRAVALLSQRIAEMNEILGLGK